MANKITLDSFDTEIINLKKEDLQKKMDIAFNVFKQCQQDGEYVNIANEPLKDTQIAIETCSKLTGVDQETLSAVKVLDEKAKKFEEWLFEQKQLIHGYNYEYHSLKNQLIESYTKKLEVPTGLGEKKEFEGYKKNFTCLQLPGTKASIIVEKPETVQERYRFLQTKMTYREAKKIFVYIGKVNLLLMNGKFSYKEDNIDMNSRFIIAASPTLGHVGHIHFCGNSLDFLMNWVQEKIVPNLPKESVIIFQENVINERVGEIDSFTSKEEMINWLKCNKVNHDPKMHRADLFKLINTFKQSCVEQLSTAEEVLRGHGHITIRKKKCNLNNNYFDPFWDFFIHELNAASQSLPPMKYGIKSHTFVITRTAIVIVHNVPKDYWYDLEKILLEKEEQIYKEDSEMEEVIDKLVTMVKYGGLPKGVKLDDFSKTMEQPYMFLEDGLRNLYMKSTNKSYRGLNISK